MTITKNKVVAVTYQLSANKAGQPENLVEQTQTGHPFVFLCGAGGVLHDFEGNLEGKKTGDKFDFRIAPERAYGVHQQDFIVKVDKKAFIIDGAFDDTRVKVGYNVDMRDSEGHPLVGRVLEITDEHVEMDFNDPLADHELHFIGEILEVRDATQDEIAHGHVHGPDGHHH